MISRKAVGLIFANSHDEIVPELTRKRAMGAIPFGGRYRLIDFALSNMSNADIDRVGIITRRNYLSLVTHVESGKSWDLARKNGGLFTLPPFISGGESIYHGRIEAIANSISFLNLYDEEYVVLHDSDIIANVDVGEMIKRHIESGADITVAYKNGAAPDGFGDVIELDVDKGDRVTKLKSGVEAGRNCCHALDIIVAGKKLLIDLIHSAMDENELSLSGYIVKHEDKYNVYGYEVNGYTRTIDGLKGYIDANFDLLDKNIRDRLFNSERMIFTKVHDNMPVKYGLHSKVSDTLLADGCTVEGEVKHSVLFRNAVVSPKAVVENCIILPDAAVEEGAIIKNTLVYRGARVKKGERIEGTKERFAIVGGEEDK